MVLASTLWQSSGPCLPDFDAPLGCPHEQPEPLTIMGFPLSIFSPTPVSDFLGKSRPG